MKKKLIFAAIALLVAGGAVGAWLALRPRARPPAVAAALPSEALAFAGVQGLDGLIRDVSAAIAAARRRSPMVEKALSAPVKLGDARFDSYSADSWGALGLDLEAGFGLALDARVRNGHEPVPIALFKVADRARALDTLRKSVGDVVLKGDVDVATGEATVGKDTWLAGTRNGYVAVLRMPARGDVEKIRSGFAQFLDTGAPLGERSRVRGAFLGGRTGAGWYTWIDVEGLLAAPADAPAPEATSLARTLSGLAERFPALGLQVGARGVRLRLTTTEAMNEPLQALFKVESAAPSFGVHLPDGGWAVARVGLNLAQLLELLPQIIPANDAMAGVEAFAAIRAGLVSLTGVTWEQIAGAFDGHIAVAVDVGTLVMAQHKGAEVVDALLMLGVREGADADVVLSKLGSAAASAMGLARREVEIGGARAQVFAQGDKVTLVVARRGSTVVAARSESSLAAALARPDAKNLGAALDGGEAMAAYVHLAPVLPLLESAEGEAGVAAQVLREHPRWAEFAETPRFDVRVVVDDTGVTLTADDYGVLGAAADVTALLAAPRAIGVLLARARSTTPPALLGKWNVDFEAMAKQEDFLKMSKDQRKASLEMARSMLTSLEFEFSEESYRVTMTDRHDEGSFEVKSVVKGPDGERIVLRARGANGKDEELEALVQGDTLFMKAGQDRFPLRRR